MIFERELTRTKSLIFWGIPFSPDDRRIARAGTSSISVRRFRTRQRRQSATPFEAGNCPSAVIRQSKTCRGCLIRSSGVGSNTTDATIVRRSTRPCAHWIETWSCGPSGNTRSCVPTYGERHTGSHVSHVALRSCSLIGRWECGEAP